MRPPFVSLVAALLVVGWTVASNRNGAPPPLADSFAMALSLLRTRFVSSRRAPARRG